MIKNRKLTWKIGIWKFCINHWVFEVICSTKMFHREVATGVMYSNGEKINRAQSYWFRKVSHYILKFLNVEIELLMQIRSIIFFSFRLHNCVNTVNRIENSLNFCKFFCHCDIEDVAIASLLVVSAPKVRHLWALFYIKAEDHFLPSQWAAPAGRG